MCWSQKFSMLSTAGIRGWCRIITLPEKFHLKDEFLIKARTCETRLCLKRHFQFSANQTQTKPTLHTCIQTNLLLCKAPHLLPFSWIDASAQMLSNDAWASSKDVELFLYITKYTLWMDLRQSKSAETSNKWKCSQLTHSTTKKDVKSLLNT